MATIPHKKHSDAVGCNATQRLFRRYASPHGWLNFPNVLSCVTCDDACIPLLTRRQRDSRYPVRRQTPVPASPSSVEYAQPKNHDNLTSLERGASLGEYRRGYVPPVVSPRRPFHRLPFPLGAQLF